MPRLPCFLSLVLAAAVVQADDRLELLRDLLRDLVAEEETELVHENRRFDRELA